MGTKLVVLGGGPAGYVGAIRAAQLGADVTLVEADAVGGTCLNRGCIPTKALLKRADVWTLVNHLQDYGCRAENISFDWLTMQTQKQQAVNSLKKGVEHLLSANKVKLVRGMGQLVPKGIKVGSQVLEADRILIATGSEPIRPPITGANLDHVLDSTGILSLDHIPKSLVIIGGGVIGCEFTSLFARLGSQVSIVEMEPQILPGVEPEIIELLTASLKEIGVAIYTNARATAISERAVSADCNGKPLTLDGETVLLSVGRRPLTADIGLAAAGVITEGANILVDNFMETNMPGIYAAGDVTGGWQLAHVASREAVVAVENAMGHKTRMNYRAVPNCIYTNPEVAGVGMTEAQARQERRGIKVARFPFHANGRAVSSGEGQGFVKVIADTEVGEILGVHIIGSTATELIGEAALAIAMEATVEELVNTIHAHPTLSEAIMEAAHGLMDGAIHLPPGV